MVTSCAVAGCKNYGGSKKTSSKVVFHRIPKDPTIRNIWIKFCHRTEEFKYGNASICSDHFRSEDYVRDLMSELLNLPTRKTLIPRAVPSVILMPAEIVSKTLKRGSKVENQFTGCAILRCKNGAISCTMPGTKLFRFPEDQSVRAQWLNACRRKQFNVDEAFICSTHFKKEDFVASNLLSKKLKPNALPTLNLPAERSIIPKKTGKDSEHESPLTRGENADKHVVEITIESPRRTNEANSNIKRPLLSQEESAAKRANTKFVEEILREYDKKSKLKRPRSMISTSQNNKPSEQKTNKNSQIKTTINSKPNTTINSKENNDSPDSDLIWKQKFEIAQQEIEVLKDNLALLNNYDDALSWKNQIKCLKDENNFLKIELGKKINKEKRKMNTELIWKFKLEKVRRRETLLKRQVIALKKANRNLKDGSENLYLTKDESEPDESFTEVEFNTRDRKSVKFVYWSVNDVPTAISTLTEMEKTLYLDNL